MAKNQPCGKNNMNDNNIQRYTSELERKWMVLAYIGDRCLECDAQTPSVDCDFRVIEQILMGQPYKYCPYNKNLIVAKKKFLKFVEKFSENDNG